MNYRLVIVQPAEIDVEVIYSYILGRSPQGAASWYRAFLSCTERITRQPLACSFAPENAEFDFELRQACLQQHISVCSCPLRGYGDASTAWHYACGNRIVKVAYSSVF